MNCISANTTAPCGSVKTNKSGNVPRPQQRFPQGQMTINHLSKIHKEAEKQQESSDEFEDLAYLHPKNQLPEKNPNRNAQSQEDPRVHLEKQGSASKPKEDSPSRSKASPEQEQDIPVEHFSKDKSIGETVGRKMQRENIGKSSAKNSTQMSASSEFYFEKNLQIQKNYTGANEEEINKLQMLNGELTQSMREVDEDLGRAESFSNFFEMNQRKKRSSTDPDSFALRKPSLIEEGKEETANIEDFHQVPLEATHHQRKPVEGRTKQKKDLESKFALGQIQRTYVDQSLDQVVPLESCENKPEAEVKTIDFERNIIKSSKTIISSGTMNAQFVPQSQQLKSSGTTVNGPQGFSPSKNEQSPIGNFQEGAKFGEEKKKKWSFAYLLGSSRKKKDAKQQAKKEDEILQNRTIISQNIDLEGSSSKGPGNKDSFISVGIQSGIPAPRKMTLEMRKNISANVGHDGDQAPLKQEDFTMSSFDDQHWRPEVSEDLKMRMPAIKEPMTSRIEKQPASGVTVEVLDQQAFKVSSPCTQRHENRTLDPSAVKPSNVRSLTHYKKVPEMQKGGFFSPTIKEDELENDFENLARERRVEGLKKDYYFSRSKSPIEKLPVNVKKNDGMMTKFFVSSGLNAKVFNVKFMLIGDKVKYDSATKYPIYLLGFCFNPDISKLQHQEVGAVLNQEKIKIKKKFFKSFIWCTYRRGLQPPLLCDRRFQQFLSKNPEVKITEERYDSDMNWGCTIRVGQMLLCNTLLRHLILTHKREELSKIDPSKRPDLLKEGLHQDVYLTQHREIYSNVLALVHDNELPVPPMLAGKFEHLQCFSLPYVAKMAFITQSINPGTWYGVASLSHVLKKLNRTFRPLSDCFQICLCNDGALFFQKIVGKMKKEIKMEFGQARVSRDIGDLETRDRKMKQQKFINDLFGEELGFQQESWRSQFRLCRHQYEPESLKEQPLNNNNEEWEEIDRSSPLKKSIPAFRNSCLVIIPCRLGMTKVDPEVVPCVEYLFRQQKIMMGAIGGKPNQALYFVGLQKQYLIFLDPHLVQEASGGEQPLVERRQSKPFQRRTSGKHNKHKRSKTPTFIKASEDQWDNSRTRPRSSSLTQFQVIEEEEGRKGVGLSWKDRQEFPKVNISPSDQETYHCTKTRKIPISRIDPTIAFAFYLDDEEDFWTFAAMIEEGKKRFPSTFPISVMDSQWLADFKHPKEDLKPEKKSKPSLFGRAWFGRNKK